MAATPAPAARRSERAAWLSLAVISALTLIVVYLVAKLVYIRSAVKAVEERYGLATPFTAAVPRAAPLRDLSRDELLAPRTFDQYRAEFDGLVDRAFRLGDFNDRGTPAGTARDAAPPAESALQAACRRALGGGKRLRPIILMEVARMVSKRRFERDQLPPIDPADAALAVECFHAGSLVVDDLPAFDNDAERRGAPSVWASTSQPVALMAAIAIMARAFQNVCHQVDWIRDRCPEWVNADRIGTALCSQMSASLGVLGAASGQFMDMLPPGELGAFGAAPDAVEMLVQRKTSPFFEMAFVAGWLVGGGAPGGETVEELRQAGRDFGTAFQIADDIGDLEQDRTRRAEGKPGWNYADVHGVERAETELVRRLGACKGALKKHSLWSPLWEEIYSKVLKMTVA